MIRPDEDERAARIGGARAEREDPKLVGAFNGSRVISSKFMVRVIFSKFRFLTSIKAEVRFAGYITRDDRSAPVRGADPLRQKRAHAQRQQVAQIAASIREFGFTNPVLIDEQDERKGLPHLSGSRPRDRQFHVERNLRRYHLN